MKRAITARNPSHGLILHTDNGSNFCSKTFENYLKENEVVHSFLRSGTPHDNAVAESFFWYNISIVLTADSVVTGYAYFSIIRR